MTRSKYIKRRQIRSVILLWLRESLFNTTVAIVLAAVVLLTWRAFNPPAAIVADNDYVAALRIPPQAVSGLYHLSQWYDVPFGRVLALYAISNDFFPGDASPAVEVDSLRSYAADFRQLSRRYAARDIQPYFEMFGNLTDELERFPIPREYEYVFSDTWGQIKGTAILDRENIRGRIPIHSMSDGHIHQAGWHYRTGYHVVVITRSGGRILYAHLDRLAQGIEPGARTLPGQKLGVMGASGENQSNTPVHLHIAISPSVSFAQDFWINPYPFLRHVEEKTYIFPSLVHTRYRNQ